MTNKNLKEIAYVENIDKEEDLKKSLVEKENSGEGEENKHTEDGELRKSLEIQIDKIDEAVKTKSRANSNASDPKSVDKEQGKVAGLGMLLAMTQKKSALLDGPHSSKDHQDIAQVLLAFRKFSMGVYLSRKLKLIKEKRETPVEEKDTVEKIMHYVEQPYLWALYFTACPVLDEQYDKIRLVYFPVTGSLFYWYIIHPTIDETYLYYPLPVGLVFSFLMMYILDPLTPPKWSIVFTIIGVVSGLAWTYLLVGILIDLLGVLGLILNLDKAYLGLTILAIGNALPDALTTLALIKQGAGTMAISGGYAGQLFGFLVGFGISMLKLTIAEGP